MLRPAQMVKVHLSGLHDDLERTVALLEELELVHILEPLELEEGFVTGKPLAYGADVSQQLLEVRGLSKVLAADGGDPLHPYPIPDLDRELEDRLQQIMEPVTELQARLKETSSTLEEKRNRLQRLDLFTELGIPLEHLGGYRTLEVLAGSLEPEGLPVLSETLPEMELFQNEHLVVLLFDKAQLATIQPILNQFGFKAEEVPRGEGLPEQFIGELRRSIKELEAELEALEAERLALATRHQDWLAAAEEHLYIEASKSELPLRLTTSAHTFLLEGWIPESSVEDLRRALSDLTLHIEIEQVDPSATDDHGEPQEGEHEEAGEDPAQEMPIKLDNPKAATPFELFINLFNTPRHFEVDPTVMLFIAYPLFFGLMVGDAGYGLGYFLLGTWLSKRFSYHDQLSALGKIMRLAGLWTILFGVVLYAEAFGMTYHEMADRLGYHGQDVPWHTLHKFDKDYVLLMINVCLIISGIHLTIGLLAGFKNKLHHHSVGHAANEKISWILIIWAFIVLLMVMLKAFTATTPVLFLLVGVILVGVIMVIAAEGGIAVLELPTALSNIISYTRILALGLSDAGLAFAFNKLALDVVGFEGINIILAIATLLVGHALIFALGIIGSGIHSLRLQYVEFFTKFYEGGGTPYAPFGYQRQFTTTNT